MHSLPNLRQGEMDADFMWIDGDPIRHIIDRDTRYSVAKYITKKQTSENLSNIIIKFSISAFTGFPNIIDVDRQCAFRSKIFKPTCNQLGIHAKITPIESHNFLSICERYYSVIRQVFCRIKADHTTPPKKVCLSIATHADNTATGPK